MANVLIIDDNKAFCDVLYHAAKRMEHEMRCTHILREGLMATRSGSFDVVFLSARMPDGNGLDVLPEILQTPPSPEVILISDSGDPDEAELAIKSGAWDYINRPYGASYHTSKAMKQFFAQKPHRITVYDLPSYSPDYNPIESLFAFYRDLAEAL